MPISRSLRRPSSVTQSLVQAGLKLALVGALWMAGVAQWWLARVLGTGPVAGEVYAVAWLGAPLIFGLDYARKRVLAAWRAPASAPYG